MMVYGPTSTGKTFTMQGDICSQVRSQEVKNMFDGILSFQNSLKQQRKNKGKKT